MKNKLIYFKEEFIMAENDNNKMSYEEAGQKGGEQTAKNHDKEFYQEIGEKGGKANSDDNSNK